MLQRLQAQGISLDDSLALRRISITLSRWHKMRCGTDGGAIEQDEETGKWHWISYYPYTNKEYRTKIANRETGAKKRLDAIMAYYPTLMAYIQTDPRGASLYILKPGDIPESKDIDVYYTNGIAVYK